MSLMGASPQRIYIVTSAVGGLMAGLAGALLIFQYSVHPYFGGQFGPLTFMICVLGGLGNMVGAFIASFIMSEIISIGGVVISTEMGYVIAFVDLHRDDVRPPGRHHGQARMSRGRAPRRCARPAGRWPLVPFAPHGRRAAVRAPRDHPDLHLVLHRPGVVPDGPLRPGLARPRRVPRRGRLHDRAALELLLADAVDRRRPRRGCSPSPSPWCSAIPCSRFQRRRPLLRAWSRWRWAR